jgi:hypothetical protein
MRIQLLHCTIGMHRFVRVQLREIQKLSRFSPLLEGCESAACSCIWGG